MTDDITRDGDADRLAQLQRWRRKGGRSFDILWPDDLWLALRQIDVRDAALREKDAEIEIYERIEQNLRDVIEVKRKEILRLRAAQPAPDAGALRPIDAAAPPVDRAAAERARIVAWTRTPACRRAIAGAIREAMGDGIIRTDDLGTMASDAFADAIERGEHV